MQYRTITTKFETVILTSNGPVQVPTGSTVGVHTAIPGTSIVKVDAWKNSNGVLLPLGSGTWMGKDRFLNEEAHSYLGWEKKAKLKIVFNVAKDSFLRNLGMRKVQMVNSYQKILGAKLYTDTPGYRYLFNELPWTWQRYFLKHKPEEIYKTWIRWEEEAHLF